MQITIKVQPGQDWLEACDSLVSKACAFLKKEDEQFFDHVNWLKALIARGELVIEPVKVLTLEEIRAAVLAGKTVHWATTAYVVQHWPNQGFHIVCPSTSYAIGLSYKDRDGSEKLNAKLEEFFLA